MSRKRRTSSRKARGPGAFRKFLRASALSAVASFSVASYAIHPHVLEDVSIERFLAVLGVAEQARPVSAPVGGLAQTQFSDCREFFPGGKPPQVPAAPGLRELCFSGFAVLHSGQTKTPVFVVQRLNRALLQRAKDVRRTDRFYAEARLPAAERAELDDYRGSGYARGHMAPAGDMHNDDVMAQSFSLANIVPHDIRHNSGTWNEIEQDTRKYVMRARGDVYVFTGSVYEDRPDTIGAGRVAVPTYLYKLVYDATTGRSWVHWQENRPGAKPGRPIGYEEFVARVGLRVLPAG